jgi:predicted RNA binding protein YcfA (HicA-like mRNA interferase family)
VTYTELARKLRALGCVLKRQGKGSHEIWHNPRINRSASIPNQRGDIPVGTLQAVLRALGISRDELDSL